MLLLQFLLELSALTSLNNGPGPGSVNSDEPSPLCAFVHRVYHSKEKQTGILLLKTSVESLVLVPPQEGEAGRSIKTRTVSYTEKSLFKK